MERFVRITLISSLMLVGFLFSREKIEKNAEVSLEQDGKEYIINSSNNQGASSNNSNREEIILWEEDFESNAEGWTTGSGWQLTSDDYNSESHSMNSPNDMSTLNGTFNLLSPTLSIAELGEGETMNFGFHLKCDTPDVDGDADDYLDDYYAISIMDIDALAWHASGSDVSESQDGNTYWCGDEEVGGYLDSWVQFLDTPSFIVPNGGTLTADMMWTIESDAGATVAGSCTDGWDAANVRISNDGGSTWNLLTGDDPYDFDCGFGWIYNDNAYDTGGDLNALAPGWGGQADWHEVTFGLNEYAGEDVVIQFAFGSDPSYSTPNDNTLGGFRVDDITVSAGNGDVVFFDNADDQTSMVPMNAFEFAWEQYFYDYGDNRPGSLGWEEYPPGEPFNGNAQLDISEYAGNDIRIRFTGRMDENDDGGNGNGLFIDDVHVWKVSVNLVPPVTNLTSNAADGSVTVSWDAPPSEQYDNDVIFHHDNSAENAYYWTIPNDIRFGAVYTIPYGAESFTVHSAMFAASHNDQSITDIN